MTEILRRTKRWSLHLLIPAWNASVLVQVDATLTLPTNAMEKTSVVRIKLIMHIGMKQDTQDSREAEMTFISVSKTRIVLRRQSDNTSRRTLLTVIMMEALIVWIMQQYIRQVLNLVTQVGSMNPSFGQDSQNVLVLTRKQCIKKRTKDDGITRCN